MGDTLAVTHGHSKYDVTLVSVVEPARPLSEYLGPPAGHHLAAAQFRITAVTEVNENSTLSASAIGSDEHAYTASLMEAAEGTNFAHGSVRLQPGASIAGWVPFEVPEGVRLSKVRWSPGAGLGSKPAEWVVNTSSPGAASPGTSPTATAPTAPEPTTPATGPSSTVTAYFDAINMRDYRKAWDLGGKNTTSSYDDFVRGFGTTAWVDAEIQNVSGNTVTARLNTLETDGTTKTFQGDYTVRNGVIVTFKVRQVS